MPGVPQWLYKMPWLPNSDVLSFFIINSGEFCHILVVVLKLTFVEVPSLHLLVWWHQGEYHVPHYLVQPNKPERDLIAGKWQGFPDYMIGEPNFSVQLNLNQVWAELIEGQISIIKDVVGTWGRCCKWVLWWL